jgi:hypothetical protein
MRSDITHWVPCCAIETPDEALVADYERSLPGAGEGIGAN